MRWLQTPGGSEWVNLDNIELIVYLDDEQKIEFYGGSDSPFPVKFMSMETYDEARDTILNSILDDKSVVLFDKIKGV